MFSLQKYAFINKMIHICVRCSFSLPASKSSATSTTAVAATADDDDSDDDDVDVLTQDEFTCDEGDTPCLLASLVGFSDFGRLRLLQVTACPILQDCSNNLRQVVYTYVPLSPSSITWYRPKGGDALRLGR